MLLHCFGSHSSTHLLHFKVLKTSFSGDNSMSCLSLHWLALHSQVAMHVQVGVIKLSGFNARAQQDVAQAVKALTKQGASEFTLDVRDNRGGLYQEGAEVAKLFLEGKAAAYKDLRFC